MATSKAVTLAPKRSTASSAADSAVICSLPNNACIGCGCKPSNTNPCVYEPESDVQCTVCSAADFADGAAFCADCRKCLDGTGDDGMGKNVPDACKATLSDGVTTVGADNKSCFDVADSASAFQTCFNNGDEDGDADEQLISDCAEACIPVCR